MKNRIVYSLLFLTIVACNTPQANERSSEMPPTNYGDEGRVYVDSSGKEILRILSEDEGQLNVKHLTNGVIFYLKDSANSGRYTDSLGVFVIEKDDTLFYGTKDSDTQKLIEKKN